MKTINKRPFILLLLLISQIKLSGQEILDYVEMSGKFDWSFDFTNKIQGKQWK